MSPKANGLDNIHHNNLKECLNKEVKAKKGSSKRTKEGKGSHETNKRLSTQICCKM
jgi:hypothetical protein